LKKITEKNKALLAVGLVSILWGTTWLASKVGVSHVPPFQLSGLRHLLGGSLYVLYFALIKKMLPKRNQLWRITWMAFILFVLNNGLSVLSIVYIPSGLGAVIGAIAPIWVVILSFVVFKHIQYKWQTLVGVALGFVGVVLAFIDYAEQILYTNFSWGILAGLVGSMTWALGTLLTVKQAKDMDPYFAVGWQMFFSGIMLSTYSYASGNYVAWDAIPFPAWSAILYLVIIGSVVAFAAYIYALKRLPTTLVSIHAYINPIIAILLGDLLMNEKLTLFVTGGTLVTLLGVYLVNRSFRRTA
jgi:drug/metabolite transporter (DMT)-like permease